MTRKQTGPEFMRNIDWQLLRKQKLSLLYLIEEIDDIPKLEALEGIICLLDALQDYACDEMRLGSKVVFNLKFNGEEYIK
jgi:hypothetical protein